MINSNSNSGKVNISFVSPSGNGGSIVKSVNNKTGNVFLTAEDVGALPDTTEIPSIEGLATEDYVDAAIADLDVPEGVATEEYVQKKIAEAQLGGDGEVDLSAYYTKSETDAAIEAAAPDLSPYALKEEIPSTTGLATEDYVKEQIEAIPDVDLTDYYTKEEVDSAISDAAFDPSEIALVEEIYVGAEEPGPECDALIWINPNGEATPLATQDFVQEQINSITVVDEVSY